MDPCGSNATETNESSIEDNLEADIGLRESQEYEIPLVRKGKSIQMY